jgi:putative DNA primase/helicase
MTLGLDTRLGAPHVDLDELRNALIEHTEPVAVALLGPPTRRGGAEWRWGSKGSMSLVIAGAKRGQWYNHETGEGGDLLTLIMACHKCSFVEALKWAAEFTGVAVTHDAMPDAETEEAERRRQERQRQREQQQAQNVADEQYRVHEAQKIWQRSEPVNDLVERYLSMERAIPRPDGGWPDIVRFLPERIINGYELDDAGTTIWRETAGALLMPATLSDGTLRAVQRVYLDANAANLLFSNGHKIKLTRGPLKGAVARLPGPSDGPLLLAEGPETGLSAWSATQYETHIAFGSNCNHTQPPLGRRVVLCRDDDPVNSPADHTLNRLVAEWRRAGADVVVATPWPARHSNRSDFNDVMKTGGPDAVRSRIATALSVNRDQPLRRVPVEAARDICADAVERFMAATIAYQEMRDGAEDTIGPSPVHAMRVDVGVGKSGQMRRAVARAVRRMRERGDNRTVAIFVPLHKLSQEQAALFEQEPDAIAAGLRVAIWRGREADDPDTPGQTMCHDLGAIADARNALADLQTTVCRQKDNGIVTECRFFGTCGYQRQRTTRADVIFAAHEMLFTQKPDAFGDVAFVVVDERA